MVSSAIARKTVPRRRVPAPAALAGALLLSASCAGPDETDFLDRFGMALERAMSAGDGPPPPGADGRYPNLAAVPEVPEGLPTPEAMAEIRRALEAELAR